MGITKEGVYLTLLIYQIVMNMVIWVETVKSGNVQQIRIERLKLTAGTIGISLLTVGGYFIGEEMLWVEWMVGLLIFILLLILTSKLVDYRKKWVN